MDWPSPHVEKGQVDGALGERQWGESAVFPTGPGSCEKAVNFLALSVPSPGLPAWERPTFNSVVLWKVTHSAFCAVKRNRSGPRWERTLGCSSFGLSSPALHWPSVLLSRGVAGSLGLRKKAMCSVLLGRRGVRVGWGFREKNDTTEK